MRRPTRTAHLPVNSLIFFAATIALWVRSHHTDDCIGRTTLTNDNGWVVETRGGLFSGYGRLVIGRAGRDIANERYVNVHGRLPKDLDRFGWFIDSSRWAYAQWDDSGPLLGFALGHSDVSEGIAPPPGWPRGVPPRSPYSEERWLIGIPHWFVLVLCLIAPYRWAVRSLDERRLAKIGLCLTCGYDLRATPDRCPECGTIPAR